jgi:hypothetical protein
MEHTQGKECEDAKLANEKYAEFFERCGKFLELKKFRKRSEGCIV